MIFSDLRLTPIEVSLARWDQILVLHSKANGSHRSHEN